MEINKNIKYAKQIDAKPKRCFDNSIQASLRFGFKYCEGYAIPPTVNIPIEHAWNETENGEIIDCTWVDSCDSNLYFAIEKFKKEDLISILSKKKFLTPLYYFVKRDQNKHIKVLQDAVEFANKIKS